MTRRNIRLGLPNTSMKGRGLRWLLAAATVLTVYCGLWIFCATIAVDGMTLFEYALLPLFIVLFAWIAFSFWIATFGFVVTLTGDCEPDQPTGENEAPLTSRTAVLMPVYNEHPAAVFAGVQAMLRSLADAGQAEAFDFFVLSDTTDPDVWLEEERAWARCVSEHSGSPRLFYRRRPKNTGRKAGNIADFCKRWGSQYTFMVVLDADSLMEGRTMVEMVRRVEADPKLGILQAPPTPVNRLSFFARLQQFAARVYGPIHIQGFASWARFDSNYWGHNAIIRVEPFIQHCGLPRLPGKAPLGGEILSHDFVEAALMARAGWKVCLAQDLGGSYEECPTTLLDFAKRDQRWCQGNMQHIRLVFSENFRPLSRVHMAMGAMSYLTSPLWLLFMILSMAAMLMEPATSDGDGGWLWGGALVFSVTMALLLLPKLWAVIAVVQQPQRIEQLGGRKKVLGSVCLETVTSMLIAPLMMVYHTHFVLTTLLLGRQVQWSAQNRGEAEMNFDAAIRLYWPHTLLGVAMGLVVWQISPPLLVWFSPIIAGLTLSVPLAMLLGSSRVGQKLARAGLLLIPEEKERPAILQAHREALDAWNQLPSRKRADLFETVLTDPSFHLLHRNLVRATGAEVPAPEDSVRDITEIIERDGPSKVSAEDRLLLLSDADALRDVHIRLRSTLRNRPCTLTN